jgi:hypothetical protein
METSNRKSTAVLDIVFITYFVKGRVFKHGQ